MLDAVVAKRLVVVAFVERRLPMKAEVRYAPTAERLVVEAFVRLVCPANVLVLVKVLVV